MSATPDTSLRAAFDCFLAEPGRSHSTKEKYRNKFKAFLERYGDWPLSKFSGEVIEGWFRFLEERKGYSEGHLAFHRSCHTTFWRWAGLDVMRLPRYSEAPGVIVTATDAEIGTLLAACDLMWDTLQRQRDAAIVALGTAGLRRSNIERARTSEVVHSLAHPVEHDGRHYYILHTKGKQPMDAVLDDQRAAILRRYVRNRPTTRHDRLFVNLNEHHRGYLEPLSTEGYIKARRRVCQAAGLDLITFQQMRRWLGTKIAKTNNIQIAANALGHKSGVSVILNHYYNPEKELTQTAVLTAYKT
ncbi:MAG: hypothetical protein KF770_17645 [Anaerolineae bacterium]|nr:hypothetical protein [Anaerolineae bacterium]